MADGPAAPTDAPPSAAEAARETTLPPPRLVGPRGAIRRSLIVWGWGQLATGDRRGWLLVLVEAAALAALVLVVVPYARGTSSGWVFVAGAAFVAVWAAQALHAERRAVRRLLPYTIEPVPGAGVELLWLAPVIVVGATAFWSLSGPATSPDALLAEYVDLWRAGRAADAAPLFAVPPDAAELGAAWQRQDARLTNETIRAAAGAGPEAGIDPGSPWNSIRWESGAGARHSIGLVATDTVHAVVVRHETGRDTFFGLVPTTTVRVIDVADLGTVRVATLAEPGPYDGAPAVEVWRIVDVDLLGERLGGS